MKKYWLSYLVYSLLSLLIFTKIFESNWYVQLSDLPRQAVNFGLSYGFLSGIVTGLTPRWSILLAVPGFALIFAVAFAEGKDYGLSAARGFVGLWLLSWPLFFGLFYGIKNKLRRWS